MPAPASGARGGCWSTADRPDTWPLLEARLTALPTASRQIDVAVVTHIDSDHIGGFLPFCAATSPAPMVRDFWFNGRRTCRRPRGSIEQGEALGAVLTGTRAARPLPWNYGVRRGGRSWPTGGPREVTVPDGAVVTVLSPTTKRLDRPGGSGPDPRAEAPARTREIRGPDTPHT